MKKNISIAEKKKFKLFHVEMSSKSKSVKIICAEKKITTFEFGHFKSGLLSLVGLKMADFSSFPDHNLKDGGI